jgi:hypothetical protein
MFELRFPPPYLMDDRHLADIREVVAEVLETQRLQVNRAGNQAVIDKMGSEAQFARHVGHRSGALDYHLGLLHPRVGDADRRRIISGAPTPGRAATRFADHPHDSLELHLRWELAKLSHCPQLSNGYARGAGIQPRRCNKWQFPPPPHPHPQHSCLACHIVCSLTIFDGCDGSANSACVWQPRHRWTRLAFHRPF